MSDAGAGAAAGADAGAGGAADAGAAAAAGANGAGSGAGAGAGANGAGATPPGYFSGLDAETSGWLQNKGYFGQDLTKADAASLAKGLAQWVKSDRGLESIVGRNRLPVPKDAADTEAMTALHKALGHPNDPSGYEIALPEGGNKDYLEGMLATFHKEGVSTRQGQAIAKASAELGARIEAAKEAEFTIRSTAELEATRAEWSANADRNFAAGQRFTQALGIDKPMMEKIERAIGTKTMLNLFAKAGAAISEDRGAGAAGGSAMAPTLEGAKAQMSDLKADKEWIKRYVAGGHAEVAQWNKLERILADAMG